MPDTTPILGFPYPLLTETADVPRDVEALASASELAVGNALYGARRQQGVVEGLTADPIGMGLRVYGGTALILSPANSSDPSRLLYPKTVEPGSTTDVLLDAPDATNPRIDQIVLSLSTVGSDDFHYVKGTATAAASLNNRGGAVLDADIDDLFPNGWMRIADVLVAVGEVAIGDGEWRDRRSWAAGFQFRSEGSVGVGPVTVQTDMTNGIIRAEIGPTSKLYVSLSGTTSVSTPPASVVAGLWRNGVIVSEKGDQIQGAGFHRSQWEWAGVGDYGSNLLLLTGRVGGSGTVTIATTTLTIVEYLDNNANGVI